ncbi:MAG: homoserine dehydrogenase [bacterium]|nr:homoserine dehydrogenase [bacterium]
MKIVNVGLIGFGTIGSGVVRILSQNQNEILQRTGIRINLKMIADIDIKRDRGIKVDKNKLTTDAQQLLRDPEIDIIIELIGGTRKAKEFIITALKNGKNVVTANKALLSQYADVIFRTAYRHNKQIAFEGSVGGCIPIIKVLRESLVGNRIKRIMGIVNGTTNFILTKMEERNLEFHKALELAQEMGFAEADPSLDVSGEDAAHKLQILASYSFHCNIRYKDIYFEGIEKIDLSDIRYVKELGYKIKLLAITKDCGDNEIECRVHPTLIPESYLLSSVKDEFNAIYVIGEATGPQIFYGKGAGALPTASAIIADIVDIAKNERPFFTKRFFNTNAKISVRDMKKIRCRYYLRIHTYDQPGVLAKVAGILGQYDISISSVIQKELGQKLVPIVMLTHQAVEENLREAIRKIRKLKFIKGVPKIIRIEDVF